MLAQHILRKGGTVEIEGVSFVIDGTGEVQIGDAYIAERNSGPKLLIAKELDHRGWIVPTEIGYCFDEWDCVKVKMVEPVTLNNLFLSGDAVKKLYEQYNNPTHY